MAEVKEKAIPTLNKFRTSLTNGGNYTNPVKPEPIQLTASQGGKTSREAEIHIQKCANIANEWRMISAEADVHKEKAVAHQKTYEAMNAEISAGTAFINATNAWYGFKASEARAEIQLGEMNLAVASVPVQQARQNAEFQKLTLQLEQTLLEVNKMRDDVAHVRVMNQLNGYKTEIALPAGIGAEVFTNQMNQSQTTSSSKETTWTEARTYTDDK